MSVPPLRIVLLSEHASPLAGRGEVVAGGRGTCVHELARALVAAGHTVDVLTRRDDPDQADCVEVQPGWRVFHLAAGPASFVPREALLPWMDDFGKAALKLLRRRPCDVAHASSFLSGRAGLVLKEQLGLPLVMTFHGLGRARCEHGATADDIPDVRLDTEQRLVRQADHLIASCPQDRIDLMRFHGALDERISMVSCGVDVERFRPVPQAQARQRLGVAVDEFVILQLGRLLPRKGIDNVILALARLPASMKARLLVVGGEARGALSGSASDAGATPEILRLRQIAQEVGVAERVTLTGHKAQADLPDCHGAADVFVTTPWYAPFGVTTLEAMACGLPVVGSEAGGISHTVQNGVTGYLVPPRDPVSLAQRLTQLHCHPALARAMGLAGLQRAEALFAWPQVAADLVDVYARVRRRPHGSLWRSLPQVASWPFQPRAARGVASGPVR